jgi:methylmalonyl-CoA mutase
VVRAAIDADVHLVGVSTQAGAHLALVGELLEGLERESASDILVVCGGVIPAADRPELERLGVRAMFAPGATILEVGQRLLQLLAAVPRDGS